MRFAAVTLLAIVICAQPAVPQCTDKDHVRFTQAKVAIAQSVLAHEKARLQVCQGQPEDKQSLCAEWASESNKAATEVQAAAFAEIDKLAARLP